MTHRPFDLRRFLAGYRAGCEAQGLDPATGNPREWAAVRSEADPRWWADPALWAEGGRNHSSTEAAALANVAAQARRLANAPEPEALETRMAREFRQIVREVLSEERAALPLRELHARRGAKIEYVDIGAGNICAVLVEPVA